MKILEQLVEMTLALAHPPHGQVILGEGNTSANDGDNFWIKASGRQMPTVTKDGFTQVFRKELVDFLDAPRPTDAAIREFINANRLVKSSNNFPSTEALMHAVLLSNPGVDFVAHTHPVHTLGIMCGSSAEEFAANRYFPDQIVLCGPRSVFVPYVAPGFDLALAIRERCRSFVEETGNPVKTILLQNHGLIAVGASPKEAVSACLMMEKAAQVFLAAADPHPLTAEEVVHIYNWTDEHFRQSQIWGDGPANL